MPYKWDTIEHQTALTGAKIKMLYISNNFFLREKKQRLNISEVANSEANSLYVSEADFCLIMMHRYSSCKCKSLQIQLENWTLAGSWHQPHSTAILCDVAREACNNSTTRYKQVTIRRKVVSVFVTAFKFSKMQIIHLKCWVSKFNIKNVNSQQDINFKSYLCPIKSKSKS